MHEEHVYALKTLSDFKKGSVMLEMKGQYVTHEMAKLITAERKKKPMLIKTGNKEDSVSALLIDEQANLAKFIIRSRVGNVRLVRVQSFHSPQGFLRVAVMAERDISAGEVILTRDSLSYD